MSEPKAQDPAGLREADITPQINRALVAEYEKGYRDGKAAALATPDPAALNDELLARAMVTAFRRVAKEHWPFLQGSGWPAYSEHGNMAQTLFVWEITAAVAREYEALYSMDAEEERRAKNDDPAHDAAAHDAAASDQQREEPDHD